jgi:hypothetical protein
MARRSDLDLFLIIVNSPTVPSIPATSRPAGSFLRLQEFNHYGINHM